MTTPSAAMRGRSLRLAVLAAALALLVPALRAPSAPAATVWWGALVKGAPFGFGDPPWDMRALDRFDRATGKRAAVLHFGLPWSYRGAPRAFDAKAMTALRRRGVIPLVDWSSWDIPGGADQPAFTLRTIIAGDHDAYIRAWARAAKRWRHPFFLRFDHEMNGDWFPWSERRNGNRAGEYVRAWRHVHDIFEQVGARNVTWVWCPNAVYPRAIPLRGLYPGGHYVDWVAIDGYNFGRHPSRPQERWQTFSRLFAASYAAVHRVAPTRPLMIAETASTEYGGSKAAWIADALRVLPRRFPRVRAVLWFNWADGFDWPIDSSASATAAVRRGLRGASYRGGPVRPPDGRKIAAPR